MNGAPAPVPADQSIHWVIPGTLGGRPGPDCVPWRMEQFKGHGVTGVVSLDGPVPVRDLENAGIEHLAVYQPMFLLHTRTDHVRFLRVMPRVIEFIDAHRDRGGTVVVHCYYGCDRTGAALACYLVARGGRSAEEAVFEIQRINPDAMWAVGYAEAVRTFEEIWNEAPEKLNHPNEDRRAPNES